MTTSNPVLSDSREGIARLARPVDRLPLRLYERKLLLVAVDMLLLNAALIVVIAMRADSLLPPYYSLWNRLPWFISLNAIWCLSAFFFDCYNLFVAADILSSLKRVGGATAAASVMYLMVPYVTPSLPATRYQMYTFPLLILVSLAIWRVLYALVFGRPAFQQRALILGAGPVERTLVSAINQMSMAGANRSKKNIGYRILGIVDDDLNLQGSAIEQVPVVGTSYDIIGLVRELRPHELIVADELLGAAVGTGAAAAHPRRRRSDILQGEICAAILACSEMGLSITTTATLYERLTGRVPVEQVGAALNVALAFEQSATQRFYQMLRRVFDIGGSLVGCLLLAIVIPLVWLANRLASPGPLFYRQERVGQGGKTFYVLKFRSMVVDAEKHVGAVWASENDPRITPAGRLLRKMRLDELPQFWNIIKGEMSLIGPRPERPHFVNQLVQQYPFYRARHAVRPGLTGWAQVKYRYGASVEDSLVKLQYDLYYIKRQSILIDVAILLKTILVVFGLQGR